MVEGLLVNIFMLSKYYFYPTSYIHNEATIEANFRNLQSVSWSLAEFRHNKIVQSPHENYFNVCRQHKEKRDLVKMTIIQTG